MKCKKSDCFNCPYPDCINNYIPKRWQPTEEWRQRQNERKRLVYHSRKDSGVCVVCGKRPPEQGRVACSLCLARDRKEYKARVIKKGGNTRELLDGIDLCSRCGKDKPVEGYKLCERCLKSLAHARQVLHEKRIHNGRQT